MSYSVELLNFEGPLHLLMQLIEQDQLEITEVALAQVTGQYLEHISKLSDLSPGELNQFIELAARLVHIKSQALLPTPNQAEYRDDLEELTHQLEEYRQYQAASSYLSGLMKQGNISWSREAAQPILPPESAIMPDVTLTQLQSVFEIALQQLPQTDTRTIEAQISIGDAIANLRTKLHAAPGPIRLSHLIGAADSRAEAVVMFLALLELLKLNQISVRQDQMFGDIMVTDGQEL